MDKKKIIGISIFVILILVIMGIKIIGNNSENGFSNLTTIYVATGGGKEDFLADPDVKRIMKKKYKINVVYDTWSNGKTQMK